MSRFARFMAGVWVFSVTVILLELIKALLPDAAAKNDTAMLMYLIFSCLTATSIWMSE